MSEVKFITRTPTGSVQLNNGFLGMYLLVKTRIYVPVYTGTYTINPNTKIVAYRAVDPNQWLVCNPATLSGPTVHSVRLSTGTGYTSGYVDVYEFAPYSVAQYWQIKGSVRFNLYDKNGNPTFVGSLRPLRVPYVFGSDVALDSAGTHISGGCDYSRPVDPVGLYATVFSIFTPTFQSSRYGSDIGIYEVVTKVTSNMFYTQQRRHYFGKSDPSEGFTSDSFGSPYITHMLVDVSGY